ncbi:retron Ec48 family effector membrane protein [Pseudomonas putida]|uniref:retron Ec48 family effector membrane protein n=1 Tax=Pseudomonas putida TaxID=303 RepID=UPI001F519425|nr:retron Ec48 family effector membrane protein [Pseudomonas putida]MCI0913615.1 retron Ec48 family effector membrane protein [Pseudomonas putida]
MKHWISGLNSKLLNLLRAGNSHHSYQKLILCLTYTGVIGIALVLALAVLLIFTGKLYSQTSCFTNECFESFFKSISSAVVFGQIVVGLIALVATIGALFIALLSYLAADKTARFTNYISHLSMFQAYFLSEVNKLEHLSVSSFDIHRLYVFIFSRADEGVINPSSQYFDFLAELNSEVTRSNQMASSAQGGSFRHLEHQARLRLVFMKIGFDLQLQPKINFFEIEGDLFKLINSINVSFCRMSDGELVGRLYR